MIYPGVTSLVNSIERQFSVTDGVEFRLANNLLTPGDVSSVPDVPRLWDSGGFAFNAR